MLIILIILILTKTTYTSSENAGSSIFNNIQARTECWNEDDIVKLRARKAFEEFLPGKVHPDDINAKYTKDIIRYFRRTLHLVENRNTPHVATLLKEAVADTIGAHLRNEILPTVRFAFYAGYVPYRNARKVHDFFDEIKVMLNTQGLGWKRPERTPKWSNLTVAKILIGAGSFFDSCSCLVTKRDSKSCIHLPTPRLDDDVEPSAIALPFKSGGLVSLVSENSNNLLLKYYTTASRCILTSSPETCRHSDFLSFNNQLWNWMKRDVAPHLVDEKLYAAYGGILRVAAAVQSYGKGLSRRNLFEYQGAALTKWHPWKYLTQSIVYVDTDWSPGLYIGLVILVAVAVYLVLISYNFLCGSSACKCRGRSKTSSFSNVVAYANVESNIPALLPNQSAVYLCNKRRFKDTSSKTKSASLGSIRTQKVYDMNENTEKLMAVIMSGNESSSGNCEETLVDMEKIKHPESPPWIDTSISQVRCTLRRSHVNEKSRSPMFSTSTVTRVRDGESRASYSERSFSESCTSSGSVSGSGSLSTSKSGKSRSSRDLAWAQRVVSKRSLRSTTKSSRTELDMTSFTTPPS